MEKVFRESMQRWLLKSVIGKPTIAIDGIAPVALPGGIPAMGHARRSRHSIS